MRVCGGCGAENAEGARFCVKCSQRIAEPGPEVCRSCGEAMEPEARFCAACGARVEEPAVAPVRRGTRRVPFSRRALAFAGAGLAAVAVVAVALFAFLGGGGEEGEELIEPLTLPEVPVSVDPEELARMQAIADMLPEPEGENDRDQIRSLLGAPDSFMLTFERAGAAGDGALIRYEMWYYYDLGTGYEFADGALVQDMPMTLPDGPTILPPRKYDPALFDRATRWEEISALLVDAASFQAIELDEGYGVPLTFYSGEQLVVAFDDEGLFYVETVALSQETEEAE